jgi:hypothetical protein
VIGAENEVENLQIKAEYVFKLVGLCVGAVAYYFTLRNSFTLLNERQKECRKRIAHIEEEIKLTHELLTILKTQHEENCGKKNR